MNAETLRSLQAPLKEKYRQEPNTALVTLRAEGRLGEGITCKIETGKAPVTAGLHPAAFADLAGVARTCGQAGVHSVLGHGVADAHVHAADGPSVRLHRCPAAQRT